MNTQDKSMFTSNVHGINIQWVLSPFRPGPGAVGRGLMTYENQQIMDYDGSSFRVRMAVPSPINPHTHLQVDALGPGKSYRIINVKTLAAGVSEFTCVFDPIAYMYTSDVFNGLLITGWQTGTINESDSVLNSVDGLTPIYKTLYKSPEFGTENRLYVKMKGSMRDFNDLALPMTKYVENDRFSGAAGGSVQFDDIGIHTNRAGGPSNATTGVIYECITDNLNPTHVMAGFAKDLKHTGKVIDAWIDHKIYRDNWSEFNEQQMSITLPSGKAALFRVQSNEPRVIYSFEIMAAGDQLNDKARDNKYIRVTYGMTTIDISYNDIFWLSDKPVDYVTGDNSMYCSIIYVPATSSEGGMIQVVSTKGDHYTTMAQRDETFVYPYSTYYTNKTDLLSGASRLLASIPMEVVPIGIYGYGWSEHIQRTKFQMADDIITGLATSMIDIFTKGAIQLSDMTYKIDTSATGKDNTRANQGGISTPTHITNDVNMTRILTSRTDIVKKSDGTTTTTKATYSTPKNDNEDGSNTGSERNQSYTSSSTSTNQSQLERANQTVKTESASKSILGVTVSSKLADGIFKLLKIGIDTAAQFEDALSTPLAGGDSHGVAYFGTVTVSRAVYDYKYLGLFPAVSKYEQDVRKRNLMVILNNPARTMNRITWKRPNEFKCQSELDGNPIYYIEGKFTVETSSIKNAYDYRLSPQESKMLTDMLMDGFSIGY